MKCVAARNVQRAQITRPPSSNGRFILGLPARVRDDAVEPGSFFAADCRGLLDPEDLRDDFIEPVAIVLNHFQWNDWSSSIALSVVTDDETLAAERSLAPQLECETRIASREHAVIAPQAVASVTDHFFVERRGTNYPVHIFDDVAVGQLDIRHPMQRRVDKNSSHGSVTSG
jgi:hypothetical protein